MVYFQCIEELTDSAGLTRSGCHHQVGRPASPTARRRARGTRARARRFLPRHPVRIWPPGFAPFSAPCGAASSAGTRCSTSCGRSTPRSSPRKSPSSSSSAPRPGFRRHAGRSSPPSPSGQLSVLAERELDARLRVRLLEQIAAMGDGARRGVPDGRTSARTSAFGPTRSRPSSACRSAAADAGSAPSSRSIPSRRRASRGWRATVLRAIRTLLEPAAVALDNALQLKRAEALSVTDDLTRLYNSRYLNQVLRRETKRASRSGRPLSLLFIDLDGFKSINDTHGHLFGSRALVEAATVIRGSARETDVVARFGGDEFALDPAGYRGRGGATPSASASASASPPTSSWPARGSPSA